VFEFLFKYPAEMYSGGEIVLSGPPWLYPTLLVLVAALTLLFYARVRARTGIIHRAILGATRLAIFAVAMLLLFEPLLVVSTVEPQGKIVSVLLDDSLSMRVPDHDGDARWRFVDEAFHPLRGRVSVSLGQRFTPRFFRFAEQAQPLNAGGAMTYAGQRTRLAPALDAVRETVGDASAAVVLVSDGAVEDTGALDEALAKFRAAGIPVNTVGVGRTTHTRDIEVSRVGMPRRVLQGSSMAADVIVRQRGFGNERVQLLVEDEGQLVAMEEMVLDPDDPVSSVRVHLSADEAGPRRLSFHIRPTADETVVENNRRELLLGVDERPREILYFEGEPRFELKFIRRAVASDENIRVRSLIRTAEAKYYRVGIDDPAELADGFPREREALFKYQGVILGSVEASYFSAEQLRLLEEFVGVRGGGLLLLGGRRAFAEGGYAGTPVAELLPVVLGTEKRARFEVEAAIRPTRAGLSHPLTQLAGGAGIDAWEALPPLTVLHPLYRVKQGASTLLEGHAPGNPRQLAILAEQRYGRGRTLVLNAQNTWLWQMHQDVPPDDQSHEILWRQLLRWLVRSVPEQVSIDTGGEHFAGNEIVQVDSEVLDSGYLPRNDARVELVITDPLGQERRLPMALRPAGEGVYQTRFAAQHEGLYELRVEADSEPGTTASTQIRVGIQPSEYFGAEMHEALLRQIASDTGGAYYPASEVHRLADELRIATGGTAVVKRLALWDMPAAFLLILLLLALEWTHRRLRGLV
jgi:uncharacterized membrane protein